MFSKKEENNGLMLFDEEYVVLSGDLNDSSSDDDETQDVSEDETPKEPTPPLPTLPPQAGESVDDPSADNTKELVYHSSIDPEWFTDKTRRSTSTDPGWKYEILADPTKNKYATKYVFCGQVCNGGVARLKVHLPGVSNGKRNVAKCSKVPYHVLRELVEHMNLKKPMKTVIDVEESPKKKKKQNYQV